jgi:hypothetical protein
MIATANRADKENVGVRVKAGASRNPDGPARKMVRGLEGFG